MLQIFNREITTRKRNLTVQQKDEALRHVRRMVYAHNETEYQQCYGRLKAMDCEALMTYFDDNWNNIQEHWVGYHVNSHVNYENKTNNRLESLNQKIKAVVAKYANLASFFEDLITCIASFNIERDHVAADSILRKGLATALNTEYDAKYAKFLTRYAFDKYTMQSMKASQVQFSKISELNAECIENNTNIEVSDEACTCPFFKTMELPCSHIIAFIRHHNDDPFKPSMIPDRWKRERAQFVSDFLYSADIAEVQIVNTQQSGASRRRNMTSRQKFRQAESHSKKICEIMSEKTQSDYDVWLQRLKEFRHCIENDEIPAPLTQQPIATVENVPSASDDDFQSPESDDSSRTYTINRPEGKRKIIRNIYSLNSSDFNRSVYMFQMKLMNKAMQVLQALLQAMFVVAMIRILQAPAVHEA